MAATKPKKVASESRHTPVARPARARSVEAEARKAYARLRAICLALPAVYEKESWSEPTFRVEKGKMFLMFADNHHDDRRVAFWCMASPDGREAWLSIDPERFFIPPYVGPSGWVGVSIDGAVPWEIVEEIVAEGHRMASPKPKAKPMPRATVKAKPKRASKRAPH